MKRSAMPQRQRGAMAVEFGLVAFMLFTALIGVMEVGRLLWTWNAAAEATRLGARLAAVCDIDDAHIKQHMRERLPVLTDDNITLTYTNPGGSGGGIANTDFVTVALTGYSHQMLMPLPTPLASIPIPSFATTVPRENMNSAANTAACS
jgi:Flp pilus assembly pilin Flp